MTGSKVVRLCLVGLVGLCTSFTHAEEGESRRSDVLRILKTNAPKLVTQNEEMVSDWQLQRAATMPVVQIERMPSDRAAMGVEVLDAITFWDDNSRYDLILDKDGAIVLDIQNQSVSDSFVFTVGPVPTVKNPEKVIVSALGVMASKKGDSGTFDMEVDDLSAATVIDAFESSDAATVFIDSGNVVAFFFIDGEVNAALLFSLQDMNEDKDNRMDQQDVLMAAPRYWLKLKKVCDVLYDKCVNDEDVAACGHWLDHCQQAP